MSCAEDSEMGQGGPLLVPTDVPVAQLAHRCVYMVYRRCAGSSGVEATLLPGTKYCNSSRVITRRVWINESCAH